MTRQIRAATAHHEAGHAIAAIHYNVRFEKVTIKPDEVSAGHVMLMGRARGMAQMHARGVVALAGEAAQRRFNSRSVRLHHAVGDRDAVITYAEANCGSARQMQALVNLWQVQAEEVVEMRWPEIARVAAALLDQRTLSHVDVHDLMFGALRPHPALDLKDRTAAAP